MAGGVEGVGHAVVLAGLPDSRVGVVLAAVVDGHPDPEGQGGLALGDVAVAAEAVATYRARSPLHAVDRIIRPVLLVHGLEDTVVPPSQAQVMAEALDGRGVRHVFLAFPGEGHGFRRPESIQRALEAELSFYVAVLGLAPAKPDTPLATDGATAAGSSDQR